jgi:hypothetical protein
MPVSSEEHWTGSSTQGKIQNAKGVCLHFASAKTLQAFCDDNVCVEMRPTPPESIEMQDILMQDRRWLRIYVRRQGLKTDSFSISRGLNVLRSRVLELPTAETLREALSCGTITELTLSNVDDALDLSPLANAKELKSLTIKRSFPSRKQWQDVWNARQLETLRIQGSLVTALDLRGIQKLQNLQKLEFVSVPLEDDAKPLLDCLSVESLTIHPVLHNKQPSGNGIWIP